MVFSVRSAVLVAGILAGSDVGSWAAPAATTDVPIIQTVTRNGARRYAVWLRVGDRTVQALLDTGSTGLRVLPTVVPGAVTGLPVEPVFGGKLYMKGLALKQEVEIGGRQGSVPIEVIDQIDCVEDQSGCLGEATSDTFLIGGDGPTEGYSAILGIGFSSRSHDLPNPLEVLGAKSWTVELPRPYDEAPGHLLLDPTRENANGFTMLPGEKRSDFLGCLRGPEPDMERCGTVLLDTGAPILIVAGEDRKNTTVWTDGAKLSLVLKALSQTITMDYRIGSELSPRAVVVTPPPIRGIPDPLILAGFFPFLTHTILYDAIKHEVGLKARETGSRLPGSDDITVSSALTDQAEPTRAAKPKLLSD